MHQFVTIDRLELSLLMVREDDDVIMSVRVIIYIVLHNQPPVPGVLYFSSFGL
jgi:hypothetical protein